MKHYCHQCNKIVIDPEIPRCECGNVYELIYEYGNEIYDIFSGSNIKHWKYHDFLPINYNNTPKIISMGEGGTPLIQVENLKPKHIHRLLFKYEGTNPTGSFKDRASSLEITLALGKNTIVVASTGNMGASIATYAACAGLRCIVFIPSDCVTDVKIKQMSAMGAIIEKINGTYTDAMIAAEEFYLKYKETTYLAGDYGIRVEGTKSIGYEIFDELGYVPDYIIVPIGNGTLLWAIYKAFKDLQELLQTSMPKIIGICGFIDTKIGAIACPSPNAGYVIRQVAYKIKQIQDDDVFIAKDELAKNGIFVESAGAISYAGFKKISDELDGTVVCIATGHGLKWC